MARIPLHCRWRCCDANRAFDLGTHAFIEAAPVVLATPDNDTGVVLRGSYGVPCSPALPSALAIGAKDLAQMHGEWSWPINEEVPTFGEWFQAALEHVGHVARAAA